MTGWTTDSIVSFKIGIHVSRNERDWLIINLKYPGKDQPVKIEDWDCIDAFHQKNIRYDTWDNTKILTDSYQNCYIFNDKEGPSKIVQWQEEASQESRRIL